jgi:hypothetical protein
MRPANSFLERKGAEIYRSHGGKSSSRFTYRHRSSDR